MKTWVIGLVVLSATLAQGVVPRFGTTFDQRLAVNELGTVTQVGATMLPTAAFGDDGHGGWALDGAAFAYRYAGPAGGLVRRLKYDGVQVLAERMCRELARAAALEHQLCELLILLEDDREIRLGERSGIVRRGDDRLHAQLREA